MLCERCWGQDARIHFTYVTHGRVIEAHHCLACAQQEPMSWLLAWAYRLRAEGGSTLLPAIVHIRDPLLASRARPATLVATDRHPCPCDCQIVVGSELACRHASPCLTGLATRHVHTCHCGREHGLIVPRIACGDCGKRDHVAVVATARTCSPLEVPPVRSPETRWETVAMSR